MGVSQLGALVRILGQARRGRKDLPAGAAKEGEGTRYRAHLDARDGHQLGVRLLRTSFDWVQATIRGKRVNTRRRVFETI